MCTGARQNGPKKSGAKGTHKLLFARPEARLEENLVKHVHFQIALDSRPKAGSKITVRAIVKFFAPLSSSFSAFPHCTLRPGRGKVILASPQDDRFTTIYESAIDSATIFSPESAWTGCDLRRVAEKRDLAKTYLGYTFRSEKKAGFA